MSRGISIVSTLEDPGLFGSAFRDLRTWRSWIVFLKALFALPMDDEELEIYRTHTGRKQPPSEPAREAWLPIGRRGGKSRVAACIAVFLACFRDYTSVLAAGERGTVMVIASDRRQARVVFRYIAGLLDGSPMLSELVESRTKESIHLRNRITIEVHTASFRAVRGYTVVAAVLDEVAYWPSDELSANPDIEIVNALRPGMATVPGSMLLAISSPYARRGALWNAFSKHFGRDGDPVLVWQADTRSMNPTVEESVIAKAYEEDPASASAEYSAQFRSDVERFVTLEVVQASTVPARQFLPPIEGIEYFGFVDPSGGSSDSMTLAVAHVESDKRVLDFVMERRPPFSPESVVEEFSAVLEKYGCFTVVGDRYAGEWPRERFREHGIVYDPSAKSKSDLYRELLPLLNSGRLELLDDERLAAQLLGLERRTSRGGRDAIDHAPGRHDDLINAAAGALLGAMEEGGASPRVWWIDDEPGGWVPAQKLIPWWH